MNDSEILFGLHELKGIGWKTIDFIRKLSIPLTDITHMKASELIRYGVEANKARVIAQELSTSFIKERQDIYAHKRVGIMTIIDDCYPPLLKETAQPPWVLYYKGRVELLKETAIAVVGTRTPTTYGKKMAYRISRQLAEAGIVVVSGLARGIDGISHMAAIEGSGGTIGVTAGGLDYIYPKEHAHLFEQIGQVGLLISEFPLGTEIRKGMFPLRNRIIAGLTIGTVVVEGGRKSGSLITAQIAAEESRDVFAVPGPVTSPQSAGTLTLLKDGAKIVISVKDIFEEYPHMISLAPKNKSNLSESYYDLNVKEQLILACIPYEPITFDAIMQKSGLSFGHLHSVLLSLLIKNKIEQLPGSKYIRTDR